MTRLVLIMVALSLPGCATMAVTTLTEQVCRNVPLAQLMLTQARQSKRTDRVRMILMTIQTACPAILEQLRLEPLDEG
jgi:hypothetical protein